MPKLLKGHNEYVKQYAERAGESLLDILQYCYNKGFQIGSTKQNSFKVDDEKAIKAVYCGMLSKNNSYSSVSLIMDIDAQEAKELVDLGRKLVKEVVGKTIRTEA